MKERTMKVKRDPRTGRFVSARVASKPTVGRDPKTGRFVRLG